jgi:hypothetical protein
LSVVIFRSPGDAVRYRSETGGTLPVFSGFPGGRTAKAAVRSGNEVLSPGKLAGGEGNLGLRLGWNAVGDAFVAVRKGSVSRREARVARLQGKIALDEG